MIQPYVAIIVKSTWSVDSRCGLMLMFYAMTCLLTGYVVVRLTNSTNSLLLEMPQGDKLHNFLAELKRTKQSMYSAHSR